jgi:ankyrin repeat protein
MKGFALIAAYNGHEPMVATLLANKANVKTAKNVSYIFSSIVTSLPIYTIVAYSCTVL